MEQQAIQAALSGDWHKAVIINKQILSEDDNDVEALGRLAYAYAKLGDFKKACFHYRKLLKIDPSNPIALKNFAKYKETEDCHPIENKKSDLTAQISPSLFLSDSSKAKSVDLINIAPKKVLQNLVVGDEVSVQMRRFDMRVKDKNGDYLGTFPDDISRSLLEINKENKKIRYLLKDVEENKVTIFIKWN